MSRQVDSKVPRAKAAFHALIPALAFLLGSPVGPWLVALVGLAMGASVVGGPRYSLFGRFFTQFLRSRLSIGPGKPEEAAPHRFSEALGAVFLLIATGAFLLNLELWGWALTLAVSALAALNWLAGICVGCQMYLLARRIKARATYA